MSERLRLCRDEGTPPARTQKKKGEKFDFFLIFETVFESQRPSVFRIKASCSLMGAAGTFLRYFSENFCLLP